jgi:hypothetical protein
MIDPDLKEFKYKDKTLYYKVKWYGSEYGDWEETEFYLTNDKFRYRKKFLGLIGSLLPVPCNEIIFTFNGDFTSCHRTKKQNRDFLDRQFELRGRCQEIKNGELI